MKTLKDLTAELIIWLDSECPAVAPPLEPYDNSDLSHNFCELLRIRLDEINKLRSQVEQEPPKGKVLSPEDGLYPCPYSTATQCNLKDCCLECETLGMYKSGAVIPRFSDHSQFEKKIPFDLAPHPDTEADGYVFCGKCGKMK